MTDQKPLNLYHKIHLIQTQIKELIRTEENDYQDYKFFNELQVLNLLKPFLLQHKLTLLLSDDETKDFSSELAGKMYLVKYGKKCQIIDYENPSEILTICFWATGINQDPAKAKGAADTYAIKYFLSKLFLIPVRDEEDPDYQPDKPEEFSPLSKSEDLENKQPNLNPSPSPKPKPNPNPKPEFAPQVTATILNIKDKFDKKKNKYLLLETNLDNNIFVFPFKVAEETWTNLRIGATYQFSLEEGDKGWVLIGFELAQ